MKIITCVNPDEIKILNKLDIDIDIISIENYARKTYTISVSDEDYSEALVFVRLNSAEEVAYRYDNIIQSKGTIKNKQVKKDFLERKYRSLLPDDEKLAIYLHSQTCTCNHTDCCAWFYEISGLVHLWDRSTHRYYLNMAHRILKKYTYTEFFSLIDELKSFGLSIR